MIIYFINIIKKTIYIIFIIIFLSFILSKHSFASDNIFTIEELEVSGQIDLEFSRNNMIENAFESAFDNLLSRILNSSNYKKIGDTSLKEVKHLVESFKIKKEIFRDNKYQAKFDVNFDKKKVIKFLENKNLFFSNPKNISTLFFPIIVEGNKLFLFYDNIFYKKWLIEHDENDLINYIMPLEEIDELPHLIYSQDTIESIDMIDVAKKYNTENYILCLIIKKGDELNFYSKINFENNKKNSNLTFDNVNLDSKDSIKIGKITHAVNFDKTDYRKASVRLVGNERNRIYSYQLTAAGDILPRSLDYCKKVLMKSLNKQIDDFDQQSSESFLSKQKKVMIHTGSLKILDGFKGLFNLQDSQIKESYETLNQYGNLTGVSIPTVMYKAFVKNQGITGNGVLIGITMGFGLDIVEVEKF